jgi:hypothetical protein
MPDQVHCDIDPAEAVGEMIGYLKGKRSIWIYRMERKLRNLVSVLDGGACLLNRRNRR